jgi:hypothetical protein
MIFPHIITLFPNVLGQSQFGGITQTISTNGQAYAAFFQNRIETMDVINQAAGNRTGATIYVRGDCPAKTMDRISYNGRTWEVMSVMPQRNLAEIHHTKIVVIELDQVDR